VTGDAVDSISIVPDGALVFGVQLPVQALSRVIAAPWEMEAGVPEMVRAAQAADRAGFFYIACCDHVVIPEAYADAMSTMWANPIATLGYLAALTERVHLMSNVYVAPFRPPLDTAKQFLTLDWLSGGRVILGVGDEIRAAWGAEFVDGLGMRPRPVQRPRPPIWIGGSKPPALRRVAERGDGWIPQGSPRAEMPGLLDRVRARRDEVRPDARLDLGVITEWTYVGDAGWDLPDDTLTGSPEQIAESFNGYGAMGVSHLQVRFRARSIDELCEQLERFGTEVGPLLGRP
jgi:alkanesulfonate monooxygenase SsuD/methylene tetrahydromethanopterin reductase-like flavin-dependent oxidoreductase (luciferase family)